VDAESDWCSVKGSGALEGAPGNRGRLELEAIMKHLSVGFESLPATDMAPSGDLAVLLV